MGFSRSLNIDEMPNLAPKIEDIPDDIVGPKLQNGTSQLLDDGKADSKRESSEDADELVREQLEEEQLREEPVKVPKSKRTTKMTKKKVVKKGKKSVPDTGTQDENDNGGTKGSGTVTEGAEALQNDVGIVVEQDDTVHKSLPKAKSSRKAVGTLSSMKRQPKSQDFVPPNDDEGSNEDQDTSDNLIDAVALLNKARERRNTAQANLENRFVETEDENPTLHNLEMFSSAITPQDEAVVDDLSSTPLRVGKARRTRSRRVLDAPSVQSHDNENDPTSISHKLLTHTPGSSQSFGRRSPDLDLGVSAHLAMNKSFLASAVSDAEGQAPTALSEKASGKRKVVEEVHKSASRKRTKTGKAKGLPNQDLRTFWSNPEPNADVIPPADPEAATLRPDSPERDVEDIQDLQDESNLFMSPKRPAVSVSSKSGSKSNALNRPRKWRPSWTAINQLPELPTNNSDQRSDHGPAHYAPDDRPHSPPERSSPQATVPRLKVTPKRRLPVDESGPFGTVSSKQARSQSKRPKLNTPNTPASKTKTIGVTPTTSGKLSSNDIKAISEAIAGYREMNDLTQFHANDLIQQTAQTATDESRELWRSVCSEVPWITSKKIHEFCRRKYHNFEARGKWSEEQDEELRLAYEANPNKWSIIGRQINRFPEDVRDRWRNYLVCGDNMRKDVWSKDEEDQLSIAVEECIAIIKAARRRSGNHRFMDDEEKYIDWTKVSQKMGYTRSRLQCSQKWKKLKHRQDPNDEDEGAQKPIGASWRLEEAYRDARALSASDKLRLIYAIRDSGAAREGKIPWSSIRNELGDGIKRMTYKVCFSKLKENILGHEEMMFQDILEELIDAFEASVPDEPDGFALKLPMREKKARKTKSASQENADGLGEKDNGEGPSTAARKTSKKKKVHERMRQEHQPAEDSEVNENDGRGDGHGDGSQVVTNKTKRHAGKKRNGNSIGEVAEGSGIDDHEDLVASLKSLRSSQPRKSRVVRAAKAPLRKSKRAQPLSEEVVVEDPSDDEVPVSGEATDEADHSRHHDTESLDLDENRTMNTNSFNSRSEDEEANDLNEPDMNEYHHSVEGGFEDNRHDTQSLDLDSHQHDQYESRSEHFSTVSEYGDRAGLNSSGDGDADSISSDASTISPNIISKSSRMASVEL